MISKSVIVFWSVTCLAIFVDMVSKNPAATAYYIILQALIWSVVAIPTAMVGKFFRVRKEKNYSTKVRMLRAGVLATVGMLAFVVVIAPQQPQPGFYSAHRHHTTAVNKDLVRQVIEACDRLPVGHPNRPNDVVCRAPRSK